MTKSNNCKRRGFGRIELILVILIVLTGFFLAIPFINTFFNIPNKKSVIQHDQDLTNWNAGMEKNQSNIPAQILGNK